MFNIHHNERAENTTKKGKNFSSEVCVTFFMSREKSWYKSYWKPFACGSW